jgi:predicted DNA binding protein
MEFLNKMELEFLVHGQYGFEFDQVYDHLDKLVIISALLYTPERFVLISRVEWKKEPVPEVLKAFDFIEDVIELARAKDHCLYMIIGKYPDAVSMLVFMVINEFRCFFEFPLTAEKGSVRATVVGTRENLTKIASYLEGNMEYRLLGISNYYVKGKDVLSSLTPIQYACLEDAHRRGYYDIPKRTNLRKLAERRKISHAALATHLRKAERKIMNALWA